MGVRAKFRVHNVRPNGDATMVELGPVYTGSPENESFFRATPSGSISLTIKNEVAAKWFKSGAEVYVDFTDASAPAADHPAAADQA